MDALRRVLVPFLLLVMVISLPGCGRPKGAELPFETVGKGDEFGGVEGYGGEHPKLVIVLSPKEIPLIESDVPRLAQKLKDIDYGQFYVVAVFQGRKPSGAYGVEIQSFRLQDDVVTIYSCFATPKPGQERTLVVTSPYHLVKKSKENLVGKEVEFVLLADGAEVARQRVTIR